MLRPVEVLLQLLRCLYATSHSLKPPVSSAKSYKSGCTHECDTITALRCLSKRLILSFKATPSPVLGSAGTLTQDVHPRNLLGWGGHHFVVGGALDQYAATLASWFGVEPNELAGILPNLRNFGASNAVDYPVNLGFL